MPFFLLPRGRRPSGGADSSSWLERQVWYAWTFRLQPKAELPRVSWFAGDSVAHRVRWGRAYYGLVAMDPNENHRHGSSSRS